MNRVKLSRIDRTLATVDYPVDRRTAAEVLSEWTVLLADGETNLGDVVVDCPSERFDSADDLASEARMMMPIEAVGEPGQSEGDA